MTLVKNVSHAPAAASRAGRRVAIPTERVLFEGSDSLSGVVSPGVGKNVGSNTHGEGRAFTPNFVQQRRFAHPVANARSQRVMASQASALRRGMDIANRVATSRGGVLLSGIALVLSLGLSPLAMGQGGDEQAPAATAAVSEIASAEAAD
ncbi:cell wall hydrolase [Corynebacterium urealyticum]|uniref:cell wall hydrolase n=1 Tax=Corynebacterium urealyticum TaxID=43771 RepID=UPI00293EB40B|nr:cell wall hydrolase [Corynebacterium urealyticum]WOH95273.1 cell wall hydrolase [Corynebacterium urealyticum]